MTTVQILTMIEAELGYVEFGKKTTKERVDNILAEIESLKMQTKSEEKQDVRKRI